jgi:hypothetical protein
MRPAGGDENVALVERIAELEQVAAALAMMRANQHFGKIVLTID